MKILVLTQYFYPENFRINDLALELQKRGHEVVIFTGKPNYPRGKFYEGYGFLGRSKEDFNGMKVIRVPLIPRGKSGAVMLSLNYLSFVFFGVLRMLFFRERFDATIIFGVSPIIAALPAFVRKKRHGKICLWVQDLWPESVAAAGGIKPGSLPYRMIDKAVSYIYGKCDTIAVQSEAFVDSVAERTGENKIVYIPNWAEDFYFDQNVPELPDTFPVVDGFKVVFAGNLGEAQDLGNVVEAAKLTKDIKDIKWLIVGDGRKADEIRGKIRDYGLEDVCIMTGRYDVKLMPAVFRMADIMLMSLKDEHIFSLTIPSKLQSYMAAGKPVIGMINGIAYDIIKKSGCGDAVRAGDAKSLAETVLRIYGEERTVLADMAERSSGYYSENFQKDTVIERLLDSLR